MVPVALTKTKVVWWLESFGVLALLVLPRVGLGVLFCVIAAAQAPAPPAPVKSETPADLFGRDTPRGTVLGFLNASRKDDFETAAKYLNTRLSGRAAADQAHDLFVVLDRELPPRLNQLSNVPEGSRSDLANPDSDLVGTITTATGKTQITVERVTRGQNPPVWLFSTKTLEAIPDLYDAVSTVPVENLVPSFLVEKRIGGVALLQWVAVLIVLPLLYALTVLASRVLRPRVGALRRCLLKNPDLQPDFDLIPAPIRLLLLAVLIFVDPHQSGPSPSR